MYPGTWELEHAGPVVRARQLQAPIVGSGVPWLIWKLTERRRDADNNALALKLLGNVDLVAGRGLDKVDGWDGIANLHAGTRRRLEAAGCTKGAGSN
jgi:hypothetical protein